MAQPNQKNQRNSGRTKTSKKEKRSITPITSRAMKLADKLGVVWNMSYYYRGDSQIMDQLSMRAERQPLILNAIAHNGLKKLMTLSAIGTKLKTSQTIATEEDMIQSFLDTQVVPVMGTTLLDRVRFDFDQYFADFDLEAAYNAVYDQDRGLVVTQGSSYPSLPVPANGDPIVTEYLNGIVYGELVFKPEFQVDHRILAKGQADGKFVFVPKNFKVKRGITICAREATDKQYILFELLRDYTSTKSKNDSHVTQFDDQTVQHKILKEDTTCTIDLSSASDRVYRDLLEHIWPDFFEKFSHLLPRTVLLPNGKITELNCIGTQGFPLTFALLSIIIGRIVAVAKRDSTRYSTNYGDDITCHSLDFADVYVALESLGFKVNNSKSYGPDSPVVESCGLYLFRKRILLSKHEVISTNVDITPIHLRGESDVEVITFMNQLCENGMLDAGVAISIMKRLDVVFYAFEWPYQQTEFHFKFGYDEFSISYHGFKPKYRYSKHLMRREMLVPCMVSHLDRFKGLNKKDSDALIQLLDIHEKLKDPNIWVRSIDPKVSPYPLPHKLLSIRSRKMYEIYQYLTSETVFHNLSLYEEHGINMRIASAFRLTIGHLYQYRSGVQSDVSRFTVREYKNLSEAFDDVLGVTNHGNVSVFKHRDKPGHKYIPIPLNEEESSKFYSNHLN